MPASYLIASLLADHGRGGGRAYWVKGLRYPSMTLFQLTARPSFSHAKCRQRMLSKVGALTFQMDLHLVWRFKVRVTAGVVQLLDAPKLLRLPPSNPKFILCKHALDSGDAIS